MLKLVVIITLICVAVYGAALLLLFFKQRSLLYLPTPEPQTPEAEVLSMVVDNTSLKIWHVNNEHAEEAIIYFGGNAEQVSNNIQPIQKHLPDHALYFMNYRGYSGSEGKPSEANLYQDALALYDYVKQFHTKISIIGRSLGSGVTTYVASQREVARIVLVTPYDSVVDVAKDKFKIFPVSWLLQDRFDSLSRAKDIKSDVLIIIAQKDKLIPPEHSWRLAKAFYEEQVKVVVLEDADHSNVTSLSLYWQSLQQFMQATKSNDS